MIPGDENFFIVILLAPSDKTSTDIYYGIQNSKVTVLGAAGGIGQPLSLLLKLNPRVTELALYDIRGGPGMLYNNLLYSN